MDLSRILSAPAPLNSASSNTTSVARNKAPKPIRHSTSRQPLEAQDQNSRAFSTHSPLNFGSAPPTVTNYGSSSPFHTLRLTEPQHNYWEQRQPVFPGDQILQGLRQTTPSSSGVTSGWDSPDTLSSQPEVEGEIRMPEVVDMDDEAAERPHHDQATLNRSQTSSFRNTPQEPVDLTRTPSPPPSTSHSQTQRSRKRRRLSSHDGNKDDVAEAGPSAHTLKRRRSHGRPRQSLPSNIEAIDLVDVSDDDEIAVVLSKQRQEALASQTAPILTHDGNPVTGTKLTTISCTICMDDPTELTATTCGHVFCRPCLMNWLGSREQRTQRRPNCPTCRTPLTVTGSRRSWVPLEIMAKGRRG